MSDYIAPFIIGAMLSLLGILNMTGNIRSVHLNQRKNVTPEGIRPFSMLIGAGTLIVGISCILFGISGILSVKYNIDMISVIGAVILSIGAIFGVLINVFAILKYNFGLFKGRK